jgi:hypothetical protein
VIKTKKMLKKFLTCLAVLAYLTAHMNAASAQEPGCSGKHFIYVAPFDLFLNTFQAGYEVKLGGCNTLCMLGGFELAKQNGKLTRAGGNGEFQYRISLQYKDDADILNRKYRTFGYFAPFAQYRYHERHETTGPASEIQGSTSTYINAFFAGAGFGLRVSSGSNRFCMDVFAGGGLRLADVNGHQRYDDLLQPGYTGIAPKFGFRLGIAL